MFIAATRGWADGIALAMALSEAILFLGLLVPGLRLLKKA